MAIKTRSIDDSSQTASDAEDVAADDSDLSSASLPIAIGDPAVPKEIPLSNLMEYIYDAIASFITQGSNVTLTHDDAANTLTIAATDTNTQKSDEAIRDLIASFITQGTNVTVTHDDAGNTLTIAATDTNTQRTDEDIRDLIAGFITQGTNVTVTHDDAGNTLTIAASDSSGLSAEEVRDTVAAFLTQGTNITLTHDDAGNTLTIAASNPAGTWLMDRRVSPLSETNVGSSGSVYVISPILTAGTWRTLTLVARANEGAGGYSFASTTVPIALFDETGDRIRVDTLDNSWVILEYVDAASARVYVKSESGSDEAEFVGLYAQD